MESSPLLAGIPISNRFAEKLGIAQEKQDQQQMTHTKASTQTINYGDKQKKELSLTPWPDLSELTSVDVADLNKQATELAMDLNPISGALNLIRGQKIFRFTSTGGTEIIPGLGKVLREITPDTKNISRRFADPAEEFGTHASVNRSAPEHISKELRGFVDEKGMLTMASKVEKPYWVEDTGSTWNPDQVVNVLTNRVGPTLDKMSLKDKGKLSNKAIETLYKIQRDYKNYKEAWGKENGVLSSIAKPGMTQADYVAALDTKYNKQIQEILKKEGFDHISYINTREGNPVESAILFDRADVELLQAGKKKITPPLKREGLNEISSPIQELEASVKEQLKQLDSTGWNRLPGAAGKRDSDPQLSIVEKIIKQHPELVKSNPSMLEKYEIYLRHVKKMPEKEIEDIMLPLWSTYLKGGVKKTTEADPLLTAVEKLAGMIEGMNKPKTVIRDKDGRITGVA